MADEIKESPDSLYLQQLTFKKKDSKTWLNFFIKKFRVTVLIIISLLAWGAISFTTLPLESMPEVKIPYGMVAVSLPGASPADIEELVVNKLEAKIGNLAGVKQMASTSLNSFGTITVEFRAEEDIKDAIRRLRDAVDSARSELPTDAGEPSVNEISFSSTPVWTVVVTGPYDNFTLRKFADKVKTELEKLPGTSEVTINGGDVFEVRIIYDPQKLQAYGLSMDSVNGAIKASNLTLPLGQIDISNFKYTLKTDSKISSVSELKLLPVSAQNGQIVRLQDVAQVLEMAKERDVYSLFSVNGGKPQNAVTLNIIKKTGSSIVDLVDSGKVKIEEMKKTQLPKNLEVATTMDVSAIIRRDFSQLEHDGLITIILVTTILFLFVGLKEAFVAGLAVPLVFCATFGLMSIFGLTLNFLSIFSLILSLGLLVDDAIVVVQATKQYLKTGKFTPEEAVLLVFHDYKILLTTTTLTTIWAFIPLVLATGIIGQFIRSIPITVSVTLAASFVIAIIINHPMAIILERFRVTRNFFRGLLAVATAALIGSIFMLVSSFNIFALALTLVFGIILFALVFWYRSSLKEKLKYNEDLILEEAADPEKIKDKIRNHYLAEEHEQKLSVRLITGIIKLEKVLNLYGQALYGILSNKAKKYGVIIVSGILFLVALALPVSGIIKSEFLPPADSEYLYVNIEGPQGLVTKKTKEFVDKVEPFLLKEKAIKSFSMVIGAAGVNVGSGAAFGGGSGGDPNKAQFAINFYPIKERPKSEATGKVEKSYDIAARIRKEISPIQGAKITVVELAGGPPAGADFEAQISGPDLKVLEREANNYKDLLAKIPGTINEKTSISLNPGEFTLKLNPDQMQLHGVNSAQVAMLLRAAISGTEVTKIMKDGDDLTVRAEFDENKISDLNAISSLILLNVRGQPFKLGDVATVSASSSLTSISHIDQKRAVTVSAAVEKPYLPAEVLAKFKEEMKSRPLPTGYEIEFGGQNDTNTESILSILRAMIVAMVLIVGTLVIQFNSFRKAIMVLATIPLALTGVFIGFAATGFTLSFPSLIGILALFGIVVKNAVIMVDKINLNLKVGIEFVDAIVDAAKSRMEAIFLTSICTIIGMIPITVSSETWAGLGMALIFGLLASTFLTLFVMPILFSILMKKSNDKDVKLRQLKALAEDKVGLRS